MARTKSEQNRGDCISNPEERKKLKAGLVTITHYMQMIDDQKEGIKETVADLAANSGLDKKMVRKLASVMYNHNFADIQEENEQFELLCETLLEGRLAAPTNPVDGDDGEAEEE
jgi:hypothetical protein